MIKPATLWALFKSCDNSQWLGDLCRALGKQKVDLDYSQRQLLNVITTDSGWMDERIEAQREKWRERQREKRERDKSDNRDNGDKSQCHGCHDTSVPPSVPPSVQEDTHSPACARESDPPTIEAVLAWAAQSVNHPDGKAYPVAWATEWFERMRTATPPWTNVRGVSILPAWKNAMIWAWDRHNKLDKGGKYSDESWKKGLPPGMIYQQENYDAGKLGI